jgi:hypothetical protein
MMWEAPDRIWYTIARDTVDRVRDNIDEASVEKDSFQKDSTAEEQSIHNGRHRRFITGKCIFDNERDRERTWIKRSMIDGYAQIVEDRVRKGWSCSLMTFMFPQLHGSESRIVHRMKDQVERVYSSFVTRVHRRPNSVPTGSLPVFIGSADLPVRKNKRSSNQLVRANGGLHFNGLLLVPPTSRLKTAIHLHFD